MRGQNGPDHVATSCNVFLLHALLRDNLNLRFSIDFTFSVVNLDKRFSLMEECDRATLEDDFRDYKLSPSAELPPFKPGETRIDSFWGDMAKSKTSTGSHRFAALCSVVLPLVCLPNSNADSERVFSMAKKIETECRSDLNQDTTFGILSCKLNIDHACGIVP